MKNNRLLTFTVTDSEFKILMSGLDAIIASIEDATKPAKQLTSTLDMVLTNYAEQASYLYEKLNQLRVDQAVGLKQEDQP